MPGATVRNGIAYQTVPAESIVQIELRIRPPFESGGPGDRFYLTGGIYSDEDGVPIHLTRDQFIRCLDGDQSDNSTYPLIFCAPKKGESNRIYIYDVPEGMAIGDPYLYNIIGQ